MRSTRKIELRLNVYFHALGLALRHANPLAFALCLTLPLGLALKLLRRLLLGDPGLPGEGKARLRIVRTKVSAPRAIIFQAARNLAAPFGFD